MYRLLIRACICSSGKVNGLCASLALPASQKNRPPNLSSQEHLGIKSPSVKPDGSAIEGTNNKNAFLQLLWILFLLIL